MRRAYKFRVYPASGQASRLTQCLRDHQRLYNAALEEPPAGRTRGRRQYSAYSVRLFAQGIRRTSMGPTGKPRARGSRAPDRRQSWGGAR